ncbi:unnamed protein product [Closterium sp. Naga37s-1]|nr:unnamed protein product [Closterium sp. Naga37s-1]
MASARVPEAVANECLALVFQMQIKTRSGNPISQCTRWCAASLFIKLARPRPVRLLVSDIGLTVGRKQANILDGAEGLFIPNH